MVKCLVRWIDFPRLLFGQCIGNESIFPLHKYLHTSFGRRTLPPSSRAAATATIATQPHHHGLYKKEKAERRKAPAELVKPTHFWFPLAASSLFLSDKFSFSAVPKTSYFFLHFVYSFRARYCTSVIPSSYYPSLLFYWQRNGSLKMMMHSSSSPSHTFPMRHLPIYGQ